jgi:FkbM family methyltransferase
MVDVGANVGDTVRLTDPRENDQYLAIEPHPAFFHYARANLESFPSVKCERVACGSFTGHAAISSGRRGTAGRPVADATISVPLVRLDDLLAEIWGSQRIDFIKIDTDGFDLDVLEGGWSTIERQRPIVLIECDVRLSARAKSEWLVAARRFFQRDYYCVDVFDNIGRDVDRITSEQLCNLAEVLASQGGSVDYHDLLFLPTVTLAMDLSALRSRRSTILKA